MRKPIVIVVLFCLAAIPAAAFAASGPQPAPAPANTPALAPVSPLGGPVVATNARAALRAAHAQARRKARPKVTVSPLLQKIAACESGGDPRAIGGGGLYRGKYQFHTGTWQSVGGEGDPAQASEAEQDKRAAILLARSGPGQWPVCSQ